MSTSFKRTVRKAYLSTAVAKMDRLLADERRWKRKLTIAQNKLHVCRRRINEFAEQLAKEALERTSP